MQQQTAHRRIRASCHCGNIQITFDRPASDGKIPVRACGCDMCTKHGAAWTSHPQGRFTLQIADEGQVSRYRFGSKTADFHVCLACGVVPIVTGTMDDRRYAVINVRTFDDVDRSELTETAADFEGEGTGDRLARRRRNWTPEA